MYNDGEKCAADRQSRRIFQWKQLRSGHLNPIRISYSTLVELLSPHLQNRDPRFRCQCSSIAIKSVWLFINNVVVDAERGSLCSYKQTAGPIELEHPNRKDQSASLIAHTPDMDPCQPLIKCGVKLHGSSIVFPELTA
ncbi:hypothetical protein BaRGS_00023093 [Batillaria attramentaria]|uniref:Uncharacterized protein n=1 Tax=Batillaria attramentaria TaxID=370345 RepID=A0ABD0KEQ5_9CAEN